MSDARAHHVGQRVNIKHNPPLSYSDQMLPVTELGKGIDCFRPSMQDDRNVEPTFTALPKAISLAAALASIWLEALWKVDSQSSSCRLHCDVIPTIWGMASPTLFPPFFSREMPLSFKFA